MSDLTQSARFVFRKLWTWWETYVVLVCFFIVMAAIVGGSAKEAIITQLEKQIEVIKVQNVNSIQDRTYLHEELKNTREALKRLEVKVRTEGQ